MFGSVILDIVIGLVFIYFLLSIICLALSEWISAVLSLRSKNLEQGIRSILNDEQGQGLANQFYRHPLIERLGQVRLTKRTKPSYIPANLFVFSLLDTVTTRPSANVGSLVELRSSINACKDEGLRKILLAFLDDSQNDVRRFRECIESWFDDTMDRVSGWYKRRIQRIITCLAMGLCIVVNADTIMIIDGLSQDSVLRSTLVIMSQQAIQQSDKDGTGSQATVVSIQKQLENLNFPVGWSATANERRAYPIDFRSWMLKIVGIAITIVAVSLGAPFWFGILGKLVNIRAVGVQPLRSVKQ